MRLSFAGFLILLPIALTACSKPVHEAVLDNGLRVIVRPDTRSPVVVSQIWYRVGSMDEQPGKTGISHVLEHMMFKGTKTLKPGEFSRIIAENGGRENAFTSQDYTAYFQTLEKSRLPIAFRLEADRMNNLKIDADEMKKEVPVVMEERRLRTEDKPTGKLYEAFRELAYQAHPYGKPIIGSMADLRGLTAKDLESWYRHWYAPNNATLVVVGDVVPSEVFALARKYYGAIPRRELPKRNIPVEPKQTKMRRTEVAIPAQVPHIIIGFHTPVLRGLKEEWEPYALDVLAGVLDGGDSARLSRELIRKQRTASSASAGYDAIARAPSMFVLDGAPANGKTIKQLEQALLEQIKRVRDETVTPEELERVKAQVTASDVYQRDSMFYQGMEIGMLGMSGLDWRLGDAYVDKINEVTAKQVQQVARKYLVESNMTVATLKPIKGKPRKPQAGTGGRHVR